MLKVKAARHKGGKVKAHKRKVKGKGTVMVKAARRKPSKTKAHKAKEPGKGIKTRNSVGTKVYKKVAGK